MEAYCEWWNCPLRDVTEQQILECSKEGKLCTVCEDLDEE